MKSKLNNNENKTTPTYVLTLKSYMQLFQYHTLFKRFTIAERIYNCLVHEFKKRYNHMLNSKDYNKIHKKIVNSYKRIDIKKSIIKTDKYKNQSKQIQKEIKQLQNDIKGFYKIQNELYLKYGLDKNSLSRFLTPIKNHYEDNIDIHTSQKILDAMYKSVDKFLYGNGKKIYYKTHGDMLSLESKSNASGITYRNGFIIWKGIKFPIIIKNNDIYAQKAIQDRIKYCRIKRIFVRGKYKFIIQLAMEGIPPKKFNKETGEVKGSCGIGEVGIDNGTSTTAICSQYQIKLVELADMVKDIENEKRVILRAMDRSRRSMNSQNFNEDGTIKKGVINDKGKKEKLVWYKSNHYKKLQGDLRELYRKQADIRKQCHYELIRDILPLGNKFYVETMNYAGLQKRSKKTTKNKNGKFNKKKRFGKSLANKAPAMFLTMLGQKLKSSGGTLIKVNTQKVKASQYNHLTGEYMKKKLYERWNNFSYNNEDIKVQRDIYSAFLLMNVNDDLESINLDKCNEKFDDFIKLHDIEIDRLRNDNEKKLSSMGI